MAIHTPTYATREEVKRALDIKLTARSDAQVDRAISSASRSVEGALHRTFYPEKTTKYVDWPNFQYAYPWRIWLDKAELADVTGTVPVVTSGGNVISNSSIFWGHPRYSPPYTYLELNRSTSASFGQGSTPQRDVAITGVFGYGVDTFPGGELAASVPTTTETAITLTNGALVGVGDNVLLGTERMLVADSAMVSTGQTLQASLTLSTADTLVSVTDGTEYAANEVLLLDSERMLVTDIAGNNLVVKRAWDGTVLAAHSGSTVYAQRTYTVVRGALGTTAAAHSSGDAVLVHLVPELVKELAVAEAINHVLQEQGGYARVQSQGSSAMSGIGDGLTDIRKRALAAYGRKARTRTI